MKSAVPTASLLHSTTKLAQAPGPGWGDWRLQRGREQGTWCQLPHTQSAAVATVCHSAVTLAILGTNRTAGTFPSSHCFLTSHLPPAHVQRWS